jgi:two-component system, cell cycle sensor histidine kinase and response regulator CckA
MAQKNKPAKLCILLVDDDPMVRNVGIMMLENLHFTVLSAANGSEAVDLYKRHHKNIALVFCDLLMPDMDGWQTLEALRTINPEVPVILVSGCDRDRAMDGLSANQPQAYLNKPYTIGALREVVDQVLGTGAADG